MIGDRINDYLKKVRNFYIEKKMHNFFSYAPQLFICVMHILSCDITPKTFGFRKSKILTKIESQRYFKLPGPTYVGAVWSMLVGTNKAQCFLYIFLKDGGFFK